MGGKGTDDWMRRKRRRGWEDDRRTEGKEEEGL